MRFYLRGQGDKMRHIKEFSDKYRLLSCFIGYISSVSLNNFSKSPINVVTGAILSDTSNSPQPSPSDKTSLLIILIGESHTKPFHPHCTAPIKSPTPNLFIWDFHFVFPNQQHHTPINPQHSSNLSEKSHPPQYNQRS